MAQGRLEPLFLPYTMLLIKYNSTLSHQPKIKHHMSACLFKTLDELVLTLKRFTTYLKKKKKNRIYSTLYYFQFSSVAQSCLTLCNPMDSSTPGFPVHHQLLEFIQTHGHWVGDAIQPSHPVSSPSPHAFNLSQHQGLFKWVSSSHQTAKVLEFQLQHQSFQWIFGTDFL